MLCIGWLERFQPFFTMPCQRQQRARSLIEVACWAHARRKLYEVHAATQSPAAKELLKRIGDLFAIEADIRTARRWTS